MTADPGRGSTVPAGTTTSFFVPDNALMNAAFGFNCNCINKYGDWRVTNKRAGGANNFAVGEEDISAYFQVDFDIELLGRPLRGRDYGDDTTVKVPGEIDVQRARRILEELRRRFGENFRPQLELEYIERLLRDY